MTNAELAKLIARRYTLFARIDVLSTMDHLPTLHEIKLEYAEELTRLDEVIGERREYIYNFVSGGWNTEYARTVEEAIEQAKARWGDDTKLEVDPKSFRVATQSDLRAALSMFH